MARQRDEILKNVMNETTMALMSDLMNRYGHWELEILRNDMHESNRAQAQRWLETNHLMNEFLQSIRTSVQAALYSYLIEQAAVNMKWFIGVLTIVILTVIGCPTLLFWFAIKSSLSMRKVSIN